MPNRLAYPVKLETDEDGRVVVTFPDFSWGVTDGADRAEALIEAADCLEEVIAAHMRGKEDLPRPSPPRGRPMVAPGALLTAKAALYLAVREAGLGNVALARRLACGETEVRRLLDPRHNSKIERLEKALPTLGKRLVVEVRDAA
jgi:antitoxin HicB